MIASIPPYDGKPPTEYRVRCPECGTHYWVFTGAKVFGRAFERASEKAEKTGMVIVDALEMPMINCGCGYPLDFTSGDVCEIVM